MKKLIWLFQLATKDRKVHPVLKILCETEFFFEILQQKETVVDMPVWFVCLQKKDALKGCLSIY